MTLCVAAACRFRGKPKIILCNDWKMHDVLGSTETEDKLYFLRDGWYCLVSGSPNQARELVRPLRVALNQQETLDETNMPKIIGDTAHARLKVMRDNYSQTRFSVTYDEFIKIGRERFPDTEFRDAFRELRNMKLGARIIVSGFTPEKQPLICLMEQDGNVILEDDFAVIGDAYLLVEPVFKRRAHDYTASLANAMSTVWEAKKLSENLVSVGKEISFDILHETGELQSLTRGGTAFLNEQFKKFGPKPYPRQSPPIKPSYFTKPHWL